MTQDIRPPMSAATAAFGVSITATRPLTVTRPLPVAIATSGVWVSSLFDDQSFGKELTRAEPRKVMAIPVSASLAEIPRGTKIVAPEMGGEANKDWIVDGLEKTAVDEIRVVLVPERAEWI